MNQISNFSFESVLIVVLNSYLFARSNFLNRKSVYAASVLEKAFIILKIYFSQTFVELIDSTVLHWSY